MFNKKNSIIFVPREIIITKEYEKDEVYWVKNEINGVLIHLPRYEERELERVYLKPANEEEKRNDPLVRKESDFCLSWKTQRDQTKKIISASSLLKWVKKLYV